jgi:hypothetical protein
MNLAVNANSAVVVDPETLLGQTRLAEYEAKRDFAKTS